MIRNERINELAMRLRALKMKLAVAASGDLKNRTSARPAPAPAPPCLPPGQCVDCGNPTPSRHRPRCEPCREKRRCEVISSFKARHRAPRSIRHHSKKITAEMIRKMRALPACAVCWIRIDDDLKGLACYRAACPLGLTPLVRESPSAIAPMRHQGFNEGCRQVSKNQ
jgi:hypothetical protein